MHGLRRHDTERAMTRIIPGAEVNGVAPAIVLDNPKFPANVGAVFRTASAFGVLEVWATGLRAMSAIANAERTPRELRMREYAHVRLISHGQPLRRFVGDVVPVAVEVTGGEDLESFDHPQKAVYVFGPEDGNLSKALRLNCHRFVRIPTRHCLNLAQAVAVVLYDRAAKDRRP